MHAARWRALAAAVVVLGAIVVGIARHDPTPSSHSRSPSSTRALPADLRTPADLYGRWTPRSWTDRTGSHDVAPPSGRQLRLAFLERGDPTISFPVACTDATIGTVTYGDGKIVVDPRSEVTPAIGCTDPWDLPALQRLFGPDGHLRYQVAGDTLTLENLSARVTVVATRAS